MNTNLIDGEYNIVSSTSVLFAAGTSQGHRECISISFRDDDIVEGLECLTVSSSNVARFIPVCTLDGKGIKEVQIIMGDS